MIKAKKQKIVTIGGGTGSFAILSELKNYPVEISAIVSMADDGGSTGMLRDELGVLPPGDVRQCLVALSESSQTMRDLFNYRYKGGSLKGHSFGNIFLSTLEKVSGDFDKATKKAGRVLRIKGHVIPVTLTNTRLVANLKNDRKVVGEHKISDSDLRHLKKMTLEPKAIANPRAIEAIINADKIVINPGNLYCSIIPNLLVNGIAKAMQESKAEVIHVCNLMTRQGHTDEFSTIDHLNELEKYLWKGAIKHVVYNKEKPSDDLIQKYSRKGDHLVVHQKDLGETKAKFLGHNLISKKIPEQQEQDSIQRTLIRHDSAKIAKIIYSL